MVLAGLDSQGPPAFHTAASAARVLGVDPWEHHFERLARGDSDDWFHVMGTRDPQRVDKVLALAEERIPLEAIATGPGDELGLGPAWRPYGHLDFVLQGLRGFPGRGWPFIAAGLASPVVRNRNMALRAFAEWSAKTWPEGALALLERARHAEPDEGVRQLIEAVLDAAKTSDG